MATPLTLAALKAKHPNAQTFRFGDDPDLMAHILDLVRKGVKTATCDALWIFKDGAEAMPVVGRRDIAVNMDGAPEVMIETLRVDIRRFDEIDAAFVAAHGEFDTLAAWQTAYRAELGQKGPFAEDMELMCEHFRLVEDYA